MNKVEYNALLNILYNIDDLLQICHYDRNFDDNNNACMWENNINVSKRGIESAIIDIEKIISQYDNIILSIPEYTIEFFNNDEGSTDNTRFRILRTNSCHPDTSARLYMIKEEDNTYNLSNITKIDFDRSSRPSDYILVSLDIKSGKDGRYYQLIPNFMDKTSEYIQRTPPKKFI